MLEVKEKWTGSVCVDPERGTLCAGKLEIALSDIEDAAVCDAAVRFGKKDVDKGVCAVLLCLRLKTPVAQPGRLVGVLKSRNLVFRLELPEDARKVLAQLHQFPAVQPWTDETFPIGKCIVEAKRGCCDYIRGGTMGSNPYGKPGLISPIIRPEMHLQQGGVTVRYLGMNCRDRDSVWFSTHPEDLFVFVSSDNTVYALSLKESGCTAYAVYQRMAVERDENATGLWYVSMETSFNNVCDGARWLALLQASAAGAVSEPLPEPKEQVAAESQVKNAPAYDKTMLLAALDLLHAAGVLTEEEWRGKREGLERFEKP